MATKLVEAGYAIDLDAIRADVGDGVWGRPHLARALIRAGYAASNDEAFDRFLGRDHPWYVPYEKWKAEEVVAAIRQAGGVSSLAHAVWYKDGRFADPRARRAWASTRSRSSIPTTMPACESRLSALAAELSPRGDGRQRLPRRTGGPKAPGRRVRRRRDARGAPRPLPR